MTLNELKAGDLFEGFVLVKASTVKKTKNNSDYMDLKVGDATHELEAKWWDPQPQYLEGLAVGTAIKLRAQVDEFQKRLQLRILRLRVADPAEPGTEDLIPRSPEDPLEMMKELRGIVDAMQNADIRAICTQLLTDAGAELLFYPAAKRMHHNVQGGLLWHVLTMMRAGKAMLSVYPRLNGDLLMAGILAHDLSKLEELEELAPGVADYTFTGELLGHISMGIVRIDRAARACGVSGEAVTMLQHMVLSHHGTAEFGSPKPPMFPEAEVLSHLDEMDARLFEMYRELDLIGPGEWTNRVWGLDRRLYKEKGE